VRYLIDGYNLMHALGLVRKAGGEAAWAASRLQLLDWLADRLPARPGDAFQIVFDAQRSVGSVAESRRRGVTILVAHGGTADDVIEDLTAAEIHPKQLTVVSNDHRLRDAAFRSGCGWITCGAFTDTVMKPPAATAPAEGDAKPGSADAAADAELLKVFSQPTPKPKR